MQIPRSMRTFSIAHELEKNAKDLIETDAHTFRVKLPSEAWLHIVNVHVM